MRDDKRHIPRRFDKFAVGGGIRLAEDIKLMSTKKSDLLTLSLRTK